MLQLGGQTGLQCLPVQPLVPCLQHSFAPGLCLTAAGGLTMGAVINMRPDLFNSAILGVPCVDCLTTMLDETIPLTGGCAGVAVWMILPLG